MRSAGKDPGTAARFHIRKRLPQHTCNGKLWQFGLHLYAQYLIDDQTEMCSHIHKRSIQGIARLAIENQAGRIRFAADPQRVNLNTWFSDSQCRVYLQHMRAQHHGILRVKMVGIILHEGGSSNHARSHDLTSPYQCRRLPVPFTSKTVSFSHQALYRQSRKLNHPVQILKSICKALKVSLFQKLPQPHLNLSRLDQIIMEFSTRLHIIRQFIIGLILR
ncbi:hypothetical protein D3C86_1346730 [compost metagenome]